MCWVRVLDLWSGNGLRLGAGSAGELVEGGQLVDLKEGASKGAEPHCFWVKEL